MQHIINAKAYGYGQHYIESTKISNLTYLLATLALLNINIYCPQNMKQQTQWQLFV